MFSTPPDAQFKAREVVWSSAGVLLVLDKRTFWEKVQQSKTIFLKKTF